MGELREIKTPGVERTERIVSLLEDLLTQAKAGDITGLFVLTEDKEGTVIHSRDGMSDSLIVFWLELIKRRILGEYR
jgi:hypothetical protein